MQTSASEETQSAIDRQRTLGTGLFVNDLRKAFSSPSGKCVEVLRGVTFSVWEGEIVAVTGASGAGKSTLLHLLAGLESADNGIVLFRRLGMDESPQPPGANFGKAKIGLIFQNHYLLPDLTALENVALPLFIRRLGQSDSLRRATRLLDEFGLGDRLAHRIADLSGGEMQRVAVARALVNEPKVVLADEPTANLDATISDQIGELLVNYCRSRPAAVVIATHNERLARLCDRVLVLRNGALS